jgi:type I restriction-modification system DNA methylase subunit
VPTGLSLNKEELLSIFRKANNLLRKAGLRDGYERFSVFSDLLFLKLKNDFNDYGQISNSKINIDKTCNWEKLMSKTPKRMGKSFSIENSEVKCYLEDLIKPKLKEKYGDVFENALNINDESILIELIELIDDIDFTTVDTDVKGDAFEFFLRNVTNGNKDLGEYYTPRHIVKMVVNFLNPKVGDKIYDSCCGTGGFLLECFKYLLKNSNNDDAEVKRIIREETIYGRELTSTARITKMNMILFGDGHSNIIQMDSLSKPVKEKYDIAVSNIPYSQKVENGNLYPYPSTNGDSVFVQHLWQSVKPGGRMAVVIPDTFLYDHDDVYNCRRWILDNSSEVIIISLPRGVFNPYTPTKTSIIIAQKRTKDEERKNQHFSKAYMYVIRNDGFELGAKRRPLKGVSDCNKFLMDYNINTELRTVEEPNSVEVDYKVLKENSYNLFPFEYMEHLPAGEPISKLVSIGKYIEERNKRFNYNEFTNKEDECVILSVTKNGIYINEICSVEEMNEKAQKYKKVYKGDIVYNPHRINIGSIGVVPNLHHNMYVPQIYPVFYVKKSCNISPYFFTNILRKKKYQVIINDYCLGGARANLKLNWLSKIKFIEPSKERKQKFTDCSIQLEKTYDEYLTLLTKINSI